MPLGTNLPFSPFASTSPAPGHAESQVRGYLGCVFPELSETQRNGGGFSRLIAFVPDDLVEEEPEVEVREPHDGER